MFKNYLKTALRNFLLFKGYTFINIIGLSLGLSCCILIMLYTLDEMSYDRFHVNSDRIYRIVEKYPDGGKIHYHPHTPTPLADAIKNEFPGAFKVTRMGLSDQSIITYGDMETRNNSVTLADPNMFEVFTIPLIKGNPNKALNDPYSVVISEKLAKKYFGDKDPVGEILNIRIWNCPSNFKISGICKDLPHNSTLQFDCLVPFQHVYNGGNEGMVSWGANNYDSYILLPKGHSPELQEAKLSSLFKKYNTEPDNPKMEFRLQPLEDIHLSLKPGYELPTDKDNTQFYIFLSIAVLILFAACINFVNLSTARASVREKEVGIRKAAGARRFQLVKQFLGESLIMAMFALLLSIPLIEILLPAFNQYTNKELSLFSQNNGLLLVYALILAIIVGVLAGIYPALYVSSFKPISILKGRLLGEKNNAKAGLRKILVTTQFVIAIFFITCTLVMHNQMQYMRNKDLGFNKEQLVVVPISDRKIKEKHETYKSEILRSHNIKNVTITSYLPSEQNGHQNFHIKDGNENSISMIDWISVDHNFIKTMEIKLIKGRDFSDEFSTDKHFAYILNESAAKQIGWKDPLAGKMDIIGWGPVIGVIKDFNFQSLHQQIVPMALCIFPEIYNYMLIRIKKEDVPGSIRFLEDKWKEVYPGRNFEYSFFDKDFDKLYKSEIVFGRIINFITSLALIVACLGLLGLVHFSTERRSKEIGIRKVAGASVMNILILITKDFIKWIIIANIIAVPVVYYIMNKWLQDFAYRINIDWLTFVLAGITTLVIALAAISFRSVKAAMLNPVESLKYE